MLARLTQQPGVVHAEVDRTGRVFRLTLASVETLAARRAALAELLGASVEAPPTKEDAEWFSLESITQLSLIEAELLSIRWGGRAAEAADLTAEGRERLCLRLREHLSRELLRMHALGGAVSGWYREAFPRVFEVALASLGEALTIEQRGRLRASLLGSLESS